MSELDFGSASSNLFREQNSIALEGLQSRYFQKQTATDGGCAFRSFNNVMGQELITKAMVRTAFRREKTLFQDCPKHCPDPGKNQNLLSVRVLERLIRDVGYSLRKISSGRSPQQKFEWMLKQQTGRFLLVTFTNCAVHARDGHDFFARNHHHWIAVSAEENLVIDSLARSLGPQQRSEATLTRSVRDGILRIHEVVPARHRRYK